MAERVSSIEVARRAGVSQSTVSRVFSGDAPNVADDTRERVMNAARELGYQPNAIARMMSKGRSNIIGIVLANIVNPFYPYVLDKFLRELQAMDRHVLLFTVSPEQDIDDILPLVLQYQVDALIITSATLSSAMATEYQRRGTPVILFNRYVKRGRVNAVCTDNLNGGRLVADVLLDSGHQRIAYLAGTVETSTNADRERGFAERLQERGASITLRLQGEFTYDSGFRAVETMIASARDLPDALFCANDSMALGAMDAARARGVRVPDDMSVIGFDDIPMAAWHGYQLTTVRQDVDTMIAHTLSLMQTNIEEPNSPSRLELVPGQLTVRASVRGLGG